MCYLVIIIEASPSYKLPGTSISTRVCRTMKEVEEFKHDYAVEFNQDHDFVKNPDDVWTEDFEDDFWHGRGEMDMYPLECKVIECLCNLDAVD